MTDYLTSETPARIINDGQGFVLNGTAFPAGWLRGALPADLSALGVRQVTYVGSPGDPRYYSSAQSAPSISGGTATITWVNTPLSLSTVKAAKLLDLGAYALSRDAAGTTFSAIPIFTTDHYKILYAMANQRALAGLLTTLNLPDAAGTFHALNAAQIESLYATVVTYVAAVLANQNAHQAAISALVDAASVIAYDYSTGWPS